MTQQRMRQQVGAVVGQITPWNERVQWWVVVVEGVAALLLGLFILLRPGQAGAGLVQLVGGYLLITSLIAVYRLVTGKGEVAMEPGRWMRVGIGLIAGLVAVAHPWLGTINTAAATTVLAIGLVLVGGMGLYAVVMTGRTLGWRWDQVLIYALYLVLGFMVFYRNISGTEWWLLPALGWIATVGGLGLGGYGFWLYRKQSQLAPVTAAPATLASPDLPSSVDGSAESAPAVEGQRPGAPEAADGAGTDQSV